MTASEDRRILRTQQNLKNALLNLLEEKDLQELSVTMVAQKAGCNRVTFYSHYKDLNALLAAVVGDYLEGLKSHFRNSFRDMKRFSSRDVRRHLPIFEYIYENQFIFSLIIEGEVLPGSQNQFCESLAEVARSRLKLEEETTADIAAMNYFLTYGSLGFFFYWIKQDFKDSPETMAGKLAELHGSMFKGAIVMEE
ncbi:TetR/AcrR family transcriptional regulator [Indiicoccus explosivorum]|uniref:TetR/AcrR family transcriptional regulator n=1 Tax=Indiicoccus explosivorum TaxID=1917864 RepID=UPI000B44F5C1|nr:TetR/AcrR family transcriptional regulator [Indiicoccus explosivorum]